MRCGHVGCCDDSPNRHATAHWHAHADHPLIEDLKRRSFTITSPLKQRDATTSGFLDLCEERAARARPFMQFLCKALGVEY